MIKGNAIGIPFVDDVEDGLRGLFFPVSALPNYKAYAIFTDAGYLNPSQLTGLLFNYQA